MRTIFFIAALMVAANGADVESWKVAACQRTNGHLSFCGDIDLANLPTATAATLPPRQPVVVRTQAPQADNSVLRSFPAIGTPRPNVVLPDVRCYDYQTRYYHYCFNISSQPADLRAELRQSCNRYTQACKSVISTRSPIENLPSITTPGPTTPAPCLHSCTEDHCTKRCKCDHYRPGWERTCPEDVVFPLWQQNCEIWYAACNEFYDIPSGYHTGKNIGSFGVVGNPQTNFWEEKDEVRVDWANGQVKTGESWAVPAVGISGSSGVSDVRFPATLAGLGFGLGRKKRESFQRIRKARRSADPFTHFVDWE